MDERLHFGEATINLLIEEAMSEIMGTLSDDPVCAGDVVALVPGISIRTAQRRLQSLSGAGYVGPVPRTGPGPSVRRRHAYYELTDLGRNYLLEVFAAAVHCEQRWWTAPPAWHHPPGVSVLKILADRHTRELRRMLADAPLRESDLRARVPGMTRSTFSRRIDSLSDWDVLAREEHAGEVRYALTDSARHFAIVAVRAAQCECQRASRSDSARGIDLPGLVHMIAPLGRMPRGATGTCHWHVDARTSPESDIYLGVANGRIGAMSTPPIVRPHAVGRATAEVWCDAVIHGDPSGLAVSGDRELLLASVQRLRTALLE